MNKIASILLSACALALPGLAQDQVPQTILVELFASQNCQACPRAHQTLAEVNSARDDLMVLTWSVDYWDYLGEADPMAIEASTQRQSAYVDAFHLRGPYTPQTVYNGLYQCPGNRPQAVENALNDVGSGTDNGVSFAMSETGRWRVNVPAGHAAEVLLVTFRADGDHQTDMVNPVTSMTVLARLGRGGTASLRPDCESGCTLIAQAPDHGEVYGAQRIR